MRKKRSRKLVHRWVTNVLLILAVISAFVGFTFVFLTVRNYYNYSKQLLYRQNNALVSSFFRLRAGLYGEDFVEASREWIEAFTLRNEMDVWLINEQGIVVAASNGFPVKRNAEIIMPDYMDALGKNAGGEGFWIGLTNGEPIMAYTFLLPIQQDVEEVSSYTPGYAMRFMISLQDVVLQSIVISVCAFVVWLITMMLAFISGFFFVRSIIRPLSDVQHVTMRITKGDYTARVKCNAKHNDEVQEICSDVNRMAQEIERQEQVKMDFISTISHELRTPLTAVRGWSETLRQNDTDPQLREHGLNVILSETNRFGNLVEELLDYTQLAGGRIKLNLQKLDLVAELYDVLFLFQERTQVSGVALNDNICEDSPIILGDPDRLRQVFVNILDNAFKCTPRGGSVTVSASIVQKEQFKPACFLVQIADTGCGVSAEDLPRLTTKFFKASANSKGSGIGLGVVAEIVHLHHAHLEFESELGHGFTVKIYFPLENTTETKKLK